MMVLILWQELNHNLRPPTTCHKSNLEEISLARATISVHHDDSICFHSSVLYSRGLYHGLDGPTFVDFVVSSTKAKCYQSGFLDPASNGTSANGTGCQTVRHA